MDRVRRVIEAGAVRATQTTQAVAFLLSEYGLYDGDPGLWRRDLDEVLSVEAEHVRDAVERWLVPARRSIVAVRPAEAG
jgi:predicted Zn-dependent peptidase